MALLAFDQLARIKAMRVDADPPCILPLPAAQQSASLSVDGSPQPPRVSEPEKKQGAPSIGSTANPNSRLGRKPSPHSQGRVMERHPASPSFVGIDVSKDRLDVHVRPSGQTFAVARDGQASSNSSMICVLWSQR
jgi:transposase